MLQSLRFTVGPLVLLLAFLLPSLALADPPARVGRLAVVENEVSFRVDRNDQAEAATINWPISSGAMLITERRGRAEVWIGSTAYRLAGYSQLEFTTVDDRQVAVQLSEGSLAVSILDGDQADDATIFTPHGSIRFTTPGRYRIDVRPDHSQITVQAGEARIDDRGRLTPVTAGQRASLYGAGQIGIEADFDQDAFDNWVADRENATMASTTRRHVSPYMTGTEDLDAYGDWRSTPEYGSVWYPRTVAADWAPYRFGRWVWVAPWGWTWIDQAPWGFAPFHYGRWVLIQERWAWTPGRKVHRPVYAPALVGWIGNPGWSASFSFGSAPAVGWFPLAPREVYVPAYRYSPTYIRQINVTHVHDVKIIDRATRSRPHESFAHRATPRAVTVVPARLLREGRPITTSEIRRPDRHDLERAPLARQAPTTAWLPPAASALRPRRDERRQDERRDQQRSPAIGEERPASRQESGVRTPGAPALRQVMPTPANERPNDSRREGARPERQQQQATQPVPPTQELKMPGRRPAEVTAPPPALRQEPTAAPERDNRREMRDAQRLERATPAQVTPSAIRPSEPVRPVPAIQEERSTSPIISPPERDNRRETREAQRLERAVPPEVRPSEAARPAPAPREERSALPIMPAPERDSRREMREAERLERTAPPQGVSPVIRLPEPARPAPALREDRPPPAQIVPAPERDGRREMREAQRPERAAPPQIASPIIRPPEPPRPSPAMRLPVPPAPQAAPQPARAEPHRQPDPRAQDRENRRQERGDERGERGPR